MACSRPAYLFVGWWQSTDVDFSVNTALQQYIVAYSWLVLQINFVDLRPIPKGTQPLSRNQLAVLLYTLMHRVRLDPYEINSIVDDCNLSSKVQCPMAEHAHDDAAHSMCHVPSQRAH